MKYSDVIKEIKKIPTIRIIHDIDKWYSIQNCTYAVFRVVKELHHYYAYIAYGLAVSTDNLKLNNKYYLYVTGKDGNKCTLWDEYHKIKISDTKEIKKAINNLHRELKVCLNEVKKLSFAGDFE